MPKNVETHSVLDLLKADHRKVEDLFSSLEAAEGDEKVPLAREVCIELSVHIEAEERALYPAAREALEDEGDDLVREAIVEHRTLKSLISEIDGSSLKQDLFDANLKVLQEYVEHHVKEEEKKLFPKLEKADFDQEAVGQKLLAVKTKLMKKVEDQPSRGRSQVHIPSLTSKPKAADRKKSSSPRAA